MSRELFHLVLPPHFLPLLDGIQPWPDYGWAAGDRFAIGWLDRPNTRFRFQFEDQDPTLFSQLAIVCRRRIKQEQPEDQPSLVGNDAITIPRVPLPAIYEAREQITQGNLQLAFDFLLSRERVLRAIHKSNDLRLLINQYNTLTRERTLRGEEDFQAQRNRVTQALLHLLDDLEFFYER